MAFAVRLVALCGFVAWSLTSQASVATDPLLTLPETKFAAEVRFFDSATAPVIAPMLLAQAVEVEIPAGSKPVVQPAGPVRAVPGQPPGTPPQGMPPKKEGEGDKNKEAKPEGDKKETPATPAVVTRPLTPEQPGDPAQLKIVPDAEGRVRFNFAGQRWRDVLEWLAGVSHLSLDWQELPGDYLNLRTQRDYTLPEAQDLINRHLLARGFTMLKSGEILTVTSIAKLNPAFVPRVDPQDLENRMDYEFVKVSFPLKWILAERVVEEIKPMLSSNGKISALKEINRFEAMDAAVNLKEIARMLQQEQSDDASKGTVVKEFKLQHRRAGDVILMLESILGLDKNRPAAGGGGGRGDAMTMQIMQQMQQMQQQMQQQQQRGGDGGAKGATKAEEPKLIVNERENSILAHAPPDKMEVIEQTVKAVDVPGNGQAQMIQDISRVKPYRLATLDPLPLVQLLKEMGDLTPQARIQVDQKNKAIILYGTLADHYTVQALIERLDGSDRNFEVIQLRRVQADAVAGTIQYMLGAEEKDKSRSNSRSMYSYFYNPPAQEEDSSGNRPFKVDADIEHNRLLVWANESELGEIRQLLVKMGEVLPGTSNPNTLRSFQFNSEEEAAKALERLQQLWPELEKNQLLIQPPAETKAEPPVTQAPRNQSSSVIRSGLPLESSATTVRLIADPKPLTGPSLTRHPLEEGTPTDVPLSPVATELAERVGPQRSQPQTSAPPISIRQGANGRLILGSSDTAALDRLEDLLNELTPPARDYHIFQLKYPSTWAYGVELNLKAFFKDSSNEETVTDPYWGNTYTTKKNEKQRLSRKKELKIISDDDSHTILVQGATPQQLSTIADLIQVYDAPTAGDPQSVRRSQIFRLQYSKAETIADTIKQVYRDLLSANDPSLQNNNPNQQQKATTEKIYSYRFGGGQGEDKESDESKPPVKYKGLLSVGYDEISNSVVVSAGEELLTEIGLMIKALDEAAHPRTNIQVLQVKNLDTSLIKDHLDKTFAPAVRSSRTGKQKQNQNQPQQNLQQQPQQAVGDED